MFNFETFIKFIPSQVKPPVKVTLPITPTTPITSLPKQLNISYNKNLTLHLFYPNFYNSDLNIYLSKDIKLSITKKINNLIYKFEKSKVYSLTIDKYKYSYDPKSNLNSAEIKFKNSKIILKTQGTRFYDFFCTFQNSLRHRVFDFWHEFNVVQSIGYKDSKMNRLVPVHGKSRLCIETRNTFGYNGFLSPFLYCSSSLASLEYSRDFLKSYMISHVVLPSVKSFNMFCGVGVVISIRGKRIRLVFNIPIVCLNEYDKFLFTVE